MNRPKNKSKGQCRNPHIDIQGNIIINLLNKNQKEFVII